MVSGGSISPSTSYFSLLVQREVTKRNTPPRSCPTSSDPFTTLLSARVGAYGHPGHCASVCHPWQTDPAPSSFVQQDPGGERNRMRSEYRITGHRIQAPRMGAAHLYFVPLRLLSGRSSAGVKLTGCQFKADRTGCPYLPTRKRT